MRIDFDTRLSLMFLFGMLGLVEQAALQVFGIEPSSILVGGFISLMTATIGAGLLRGASRERNGRHEHPSEERPDDRLPEREDRDG